ncbi:MAG: AzlD domain-containing protein, partial [Oscillospiraceae bacterium]|nr:AzlD domain-containing protein [Oscillospiraceae bacterium]
MDAVKIWIIIVGMGIVTYIPRALPAAFIDKMKFGKR